LITVCFARRSGHPELSQRRCNRPEAELNVAQGNLSQRTLGSKKAVLKLGR
jgi:hypothetical protein